QASAVLAADIRLGSPQPLPEAYFTEAARRGLRCARSTNLLSVVFNGEASQLTNVAAVSAGYPLRGRVLVAGEPFARGSPAAGIPAPGEAWPGSKLLAAVGGQVGSQLSIGAASLLSVLLCAIAVAMTARRYVHRHLDAVALLKTLGATRAFTLAVSVLQLLSLALLAAVAGAALGFLAQEWLLRTIRGLLAVTDLPAASLSPLAIGFVTAIALLAGFAPPPP